jgi:hypothetical protein
MEMEQYMKRIRVAIIILLGSGTYNSMAQVTVTIRDSFPDSVAIVEKDSRIDEMMDKKITIVKTNKVASTKTVMIDRYGRVNLPGFRLQVLTSTDRSQIYAAKAKLYQQFPGNAIYVIAQAPFFKLRFGNFTTKAEAEKYKKMLSPLFPAGVYIVTDIIESRVKLKSKTEVKTNEKDEN